MTKSTGTVLSDSFSIGNDFMAELMKMSQKEPSLLTYGYVPTVIYLYRFVTFFEEVFADDINIIRI